MAPCAELVLFVHTGDRKNSGTNNTVTIVLHGKDGTSSKPMALNKLFENDLEENEIDTYKVPPENVQDMDMAVEIERVEFWKSAWLGLISDDWFLDKIVVENIGTNATFVFPFLRWVKSGHHYNIKQFDTCLPQYDEFPDQRKRELEGKKKSYQYQQKIPGGPVQCKTLPPDENFSFDYMWDLAKLNLKLTTHSKVSTIHALDWDSIENMKKIFRSPAFETPRRINAWDSDVEFGNMRICGVSPAIIRVLTALPDNFPVTDQLVGPLLEGMNLQEAMDKKRLFITNYAILEGVYIRRGSVLCSPMVLFYLSDDKRLLPVAIQLFQEPGPDNPIFTPQDPHLTWTYAKMWCNHADAMLHQSLPHLGFTHLRIEGIAVATHRHMSPSHPVFKILAPHFLYLIAINARAVVNLLADGGWVDQTMTIGSKGMKELIIKGFDDWRMDIEGQLPEDMNSRGISRQSARDQQEDKGEEHQDTRTLRLSGSRGSAKLHQRLK